MNYLDDVDLKQLRIFDAVVKCGGFTAAQEMLNINCSTISKAISELERRLDVTLCKRGRGGFELTEQGEMLYQLNFKLFDAIGDYVNAVGSIGKTAPRTFRIAVVDNTMTDPHSHFLHGLQQLQREEPNLNIDLQILASDDTPLSLLSGTLDIAVALVYRNISGLRVCHLYNEEVVPYVAAQHEVLWRQSALSLEDIAELRLTTYTHQDPGALLGADDNRRFFFCPQIEGVLILALTGNHVAMLPKFYAQRWVDSGHLKAINVDGLCIDSPISAMCKVNGPNQDLIDRFIDIMCNEAILKSAG